MDRGTWRATVHRVAQSQTWLKWLSVPFCNWRELAFTDLEREHVTQSHKYWTTWSSGCLSSAYARDSTCVVACSFLYCHILKHIEFLLFLHLRQAKSHLLPPWLDDQSEGSDFIYFPIWQQRGRPPKEMKTCLHKDLYFNIQNSLIHHNPESEVAQISINLQTGK